MRIFLAGATGVIGRRLVLLLRAAGYEVTGTTRSPEKAKLLAKAGIAPALVDVLDAVALMRAVAEARPEAVIHQLTDLPHGLAPARMEEATIRNARIRSDGTRNLIAAALAAGARRLIAQSIAWAYAPGPEPHGEDDPLDRAAEGRRGLSVKGVAALEDQTLSAPLDGIVLRYGQLYGPGTGADAKGSIPLHADAAAHAALLALTRGARGAYNIAEDNPHVATAKAERELGFDPDFRLEDET